MKKWSPADGADFTGGEKAGSGEIGEEITHGAGIVVRLAEKFGSPAGAAAKQSGDRLSVVKTMPGEFEHGAEIIGGGGNVRIGPEDDDVGEHGRGVMRDGGGVKRMEAPRRIAGETGPQRW